MAQRQLHARGALAGPVGRRNLYVAPSVGRRTAPRHAVRRRRRDEARIGAVSVVVGATALNGALALYHLGTRSLWLDEGYTWLASTQSLHQIWAQSAGDGGHLLFYYLLVHLATALFGDGPAAMRLPSVLAGTAAVPLVYLLGRRIGSGRPVGVYSAVLFAISSPLVFWQQNARDYSLLVLLAVVTMLLLVLAVQTRKSVALVGWGIVTALACYTHLEEGLLAAAELLTLLAWPSGRALGKRLMAVLAVLGAGLVPAAVAFARHPHAQTAVLGPPSAQALEEVATFLASGTTSGLPIGEAGVALLAVTGALWLGAALWLVGEIRRWGLRPRNFGPALALSCLVVPFGLSLLMTETLDPVFLDRYLIVCLPAAAIVAGWALSRPRPRALGVHGLVYLSLFRLGVLLPYSSVPLADYSGATAFVTAHARRGDCIAFDGQAPVMIYDYYSVRPPAAGAGRILPRQVLPAAPNGDRPAVVQYVSSLAVTYFRTPAQVQAAAAMCPRLWLYENDSGLADGTALQRANYAAFLVFRQELTTDYGKAVDHRFFRVELQLFPHVP